MDTHDTESSDNSIQQLRSQLKTSETIIAELKQEKEEMGANFEYKRSKIKELYFAKENTIRELNAQLLNSGQQISNLESTVAQLNEEIDNIKMIASVSENTKEEAVEDLNKHHQDEIESLRRVLRDTMDEQRAELVGHFEQERRRWEQERNKYESEFKALPSDMNEAIRTRKEENAIKDSQLGLTMEAALSEAETLKAVVVPLEAEITELKRKLAISEESIEKEREKYKKDDGDKLEGSDSEACLIPVVSCRNDENTMSSSQETDLLSSLSENFSYKDLETHISNLSEQKLVLQKENDTLKQEMHEVCRSLENEISKHSALSQTWKAANEQFLAFQRLHTNDMGAVHQIVSSTQWKEIQKLSKIEIGQNTKEIGKNTDNTNLPTSRAAENDEFSPFQSHVTSVLASSSTNDSLSTTLTEFQDNISISSVSSMPGQTVIHCPSAESLKPVFSAPHLHLLANEKSSDTKTQNETPRAWDEVSPSPSTSTSDKQFTCINAAENKVLALQEKVVSLEKLREEEKKMRLNMEEEINDAAEAAQQQIKELAEKLSSLEKQIDDDKIWRKKKETEDLRRLTLLQKDREQVYFELHQLKKENDAVKASYEKHRLDASREPILPMTAEGLRVQVHKYREALIATQVEKSHMESLLQSRLSFAQDCLSAEQVAKEQIESALNSELGVMRVQLATLQGIQGRFETAMAEYKELQFRYDKEQSVTDAIRTKSNNIIKDLKEKLKLELSIKNELETKLSESKHQLRSLQESLETSEQVQQDFVRLSQSLQMQLEEIRLRDEEKVNNTKSTEVPPTSPNHNPG